MMPTLWPGESSESCLSAGLVCSVDDDDEQCTECGHDFAELAS